MRFIMTLQQLKYAITIADKGSFSKAAEVAYVSQPSLSQAMKELEAELGIQIFNRTNRGLTITSRGEEFLSYARQVVEQYGLLEEKYILRQVEKKRFSVSTQHYSFAVKAFVNTVKRLEQDRYELAIKETKTFEVIEDVRHLKSDIGILYLNHFNKMIMQKLFKEYELEFTHLFTCNIYAYMWSQNPLAKQKTVTLEELQAYPCLSFEQGHHNSFYFAEEVLSTFEYKQIIKANDRATMLNLMKGLNAFTLCSGIISADLNGNDYVAVELDSDETMEIGYLRKATISKNEIEAVYVEEIMKIYNQEE